MMMKKINKRCDRFSGQVYFLVISVGGRSLKLAIRLRRANLAGSTPAKISRIKIRLLRSLLLILVNLVYTNWNYLVSDFYRIKGIATVLYHINYTPDNSRTLKH